MFGKLIHNLLTTLRITTRPAIKAYDGYGDDKEILIYGHVFRISPLPRQRFRHNFFLNLFAVIRLFIVRTRRRAKVRAELGDEVIHTVTDDEGFFKLEWRPQRKLPPGWHTVHVHFLDRETEFVRASAHCDVFVPHRCQYNFVSDIDDTFLVSHTRNIFKRLYVLITRNARSRIPFEGVVKHYRLLAASNASHGVPNPFFYVSNSEWNLYGYIREFCRKEQMPRGIFLLSKLKRLRWIFKRATRSEYEGKYKRIARIIRLFPNHKYVLLGDNSQADPAIYDSLVRDFPGKIFSVYIRKISASKHKSAAPHIESIAQQGVHCCYYRHSNEAIQHSVRVGLINPEIPDTL